MQETTNQKLSDIVDDALSELNAINSNGDLDYDVYVELHNIISNIYNRLSAAAVLIQFAGQDLRRKNGCRGNRR